MRRRSFGCDRLGRWLTLGIVCGAIAIPASAAEPVPTTPWPATDALGRVTPVAGEVPSPRPGKFVGIFYFLTHNDPAQHGPKAGPNDIARILEQDPEALKHPESPLWKSPGEYYWGQPLLGYYRSEDSWVIRRHAQLLAAAGVDTLIFDTTNNVTYPEVYSKICEVFEAIRKEGGRTPQLCFMVNTQAGETAQTLYKELYEPGRHRELWFHWQGKPLLICDPGEASPSGRRNSPSGRPIGLSRSSTPPTPGTGNRPIRRSTATPTTRKLPSRSTWRSRRTSARATARSLT